MQKAIAFFERNVQWFALGLGGVFLLWTVYAYVAQPKASVELKDKKGQKFGPGEVESQILAGPADRINNDIRNGKIPVIDRDPVVATFTSKLNKAEKAPRVAVAIWPTPNTGQFVPTDVGPGTVTTGAV